MVLFKKPSITANLHGIVSLELIGIFFFFYVKENQDLPRLV